MLAAFHFLTRVSCSRGRVCEVIPPFKKRGPRAQSGDQCWGSASPRCQHRHPSLGTAAPLVWAAPRLSPTGSDAAVLAHYPSNKAAAYGVLAFSAGKAGWVMAVWCRNLPVLRAGGQTFASLIAKWVRKCWVWMSIVGCMARNSSPGSYKTNQKEGRDFVWFVGSLSDHQVRWRSQSCPLPALSELRWWSEVPTLEGNQQYFLLWLILNVLS